MKRQRAFLDNDKSSRVTKRRALAASSRGFTRDSTVTMARQLGATASKRTVEEKNVDIVNGSLSLISGASTWSVVAFLQSGLSAGSGPENRIGRRCNITSVFIRWFCNQTGGVTEKRWMLIYDKAPDGISVPPVGDILNTNNINGMMKLENSDRFMVIHDEYMDRNAGNATYTQAGSFYKKFKEPLQMVWGPTGGTSADIRTGGLYLLWCAPHHHQGGTMEYCTRVRYTDA